MSETICTFCKEPYDTINFDELARIFDYKGTTAHDLQWFECDLHRGVKNASIDKRALRKLKNIASRTLRAIEKVNLDLKEITNIREVIDPLRFVSELDTRHAEGIIDSFLNNVESIQKWCEAQDRIEVYFRRRARLYDLVCLAIVIFSDRDFEIPKGVCRSAKETSKNYRGAREATIVRLVRALILTLHTSDAELVNLTKTEYGLTTQVDDALKLYFGSIDLAAKKELS